jgi:hypothetical protein
VDVKGKVCPAEKKKGRKVKDMGRNFNFKGVNSGL